MDIDKYISAIQGHLDIIVAEDSDQTDDNVETWQEVLIHGNPEGLRSLARLLLQIADTNQDENADLPVGAREHTDLRPGWDLGKNSKRVIIGRLDAKGTGEFYESYISRDLQ